MTDANVVLGYLDPDHLLGGDLSVDASAAKRAITKIAEARGLGLLEAAYGVHLVANANMTRAIRAVSSERGRDPRTFSLVAYGGSGPAHAAGMARSLEMERVIVPRFPGLFSAFGLLVADFEYYGVRTTVGLDAGMDKNTLSRLYKELTEGLRENWRADGLSDESVFVQKLADLRYLGQSSELTVPCPEGPITEETPGILQVLFKQEYARTYGVEDIEERVQLVNLRLTATGRRKQSNPLDSANAIISGAHVQSRKWQAHQRDAYFGPDYGLIETPILARSDLATNSAHEGPIIIEEYDTTIVIPPQCSVILDEWQNVIINIGR